MSNAALLWRNLADAGLLTASAAVSGMPVSQLQGEHVRKPWRAAGASAHVICDFGAAVDLDTVGLFGITAGASATARLRLSTADATGAAGDALDTTAVASGTQFFDVDHGALVWAGAAAVTGRWLRIDLAEPGAAHLEAGRIVAGARTAFATNFAPGSGRGRIDPSIRTATLGAGTLIDRRRSRRFLDLGFDWVTAAEWADIVEPIERERGLTDDVLVMIDPESTNLPRDTVWGLLSDMSPSQFTAIPDLVSTRYRVEERL